VVRLLDTRDWKSVARQDVPIQVRRQAKFQVIASTNAILIYARYVSDKINSQLADNKVPA
jgi:hypothetical protein